MSKRDSDDPARRVLPSGPFSERGDGSFQRFVESNPILLLTIGVASIVAYGVAITSFTLSIDEEIVLALGSQGLEWLRQGRFTVAIIKWLLGDLPPLPFLNPLLAVSALAASAVVWGFVFDRASGGRLSRSVGLLAFSAFYVTAPTHAYSLTFNTYNVEIFLGFLLSSLAVLFAWRWCSTEGSRSDLVISFVLATLALGTYQSFGFVYAAGVTAALCIRLIAVAPGAQPPGRLATPRTLARLAAPLVAAAALTGAITVVTVPQGGYVESLILWGKLPADQIVARIVEGVGAFLAGDGFFGGWVVVLTLGVAALALPVLLIRAVSQRRWAAPLLALCLVALPFGMDIALGGPAPLRAQQTLPLAFGSLWLLLPLLLESSRVVKWGIVVGTLVLVAWNSAATNRLFMSEQFAYQYDRDRALLIVGALIDQGWSGDWTPIVAIGRSPRIDRPYMVYSETFGASFLDWRSPSLFLQTMGYQLQWPTEEQRQRAVVLSEPMPPWPAKGSVALRDGLAIVKLSDGPDDGVR